MAFLRISGRNAVYRNQVVLVRVCQRSISVPYAKERAEGRQLQETHMGTAGQWVRGIVANSQIEPMATESVLKSLDKHVGQDERSLMRAREVLDYLDQEL